jgi:XTP/dITP diphosphohydrolase
MALRLQPGARLVIATHNAGKAREIGELLDNQFEVVTAGELGLPEPVEDASSFEGNALIKARAAAQGAGLVALSDDSGLSAAALGGAPGVHSARWAGPDRDFTQAMAKLEARLAEIGADDDRAWFTCALAVAWPDGPAAVVQGEAHGRLSFPPRGERGFGYDPVFVPDGHTRTFGEMAPAEKDAISHRARAFAKLRAALFD